MIGSLLGGQVQTPPTAPPLGGMDGFFNNLDSTLNSPSKALGLGLLGRINPALGVGGLLFSGFGGIDGISKGIRGLL